MARHNIARFLARASRKLKALHSLRESHGDIVVKKSNESIAKVFDLPISRWKVEENVFRSEAELFDCTSHLLWGASAWYVPYHEESHFIPAGFSFFLRAWTRCCSALEEPNNFVPPLLSWIFSVRFASEEQY
jgi:hypothetical protein